MMKVIEGFKCMSSYPNSRNDTVTMLEAFSN